MAEDDVFQLETNFLQLAQKIEKDLPQPCSIYNQLILTARGLSTYFNFYILSKRPECHVVISISKNNEDIEMHCMSEEVSLLTEALSCTHLIDWNKEMCFFHIQSHIIPGIKELVQNKPSSKVELIPCYIYISKDLPNSTLSCPQGFDIKLLGKKDIRKMFDTWDYRQLSDFNRINRLASSGLACGVYLSPSTPSKYLNLNYVTNASDEDIPIAWMTMGSNGCLSILHTDEKYRRRGFGSLVVQAFAALVKNEGYIPHAFVQEDNVMSKSLFDKIRWEKYPCASIKFSVKGK